MDSSAEKAAADAMVPAFGKTPPKRRIDVEQTAATTQKAFMFHDVRDFETHSGKRTRRETTRDPWDASARSISSSADVPGGGDMPHMVYNTKCTRSLDVY